MVCRTYVVKKDPGRDRQKQEQISPNHVQVILKSSVELYLKTRFIFHFPSRRYCRTEKSVPTFQFDRNIHYPEIAARVAIASRRKC